VYDVNGTVGIFLTAAEHGLNKLPEKEKPGERGRRITATPLQPQQARGPPRTAATTLLMVQCHPRQSSFCKSRAMLYTCLQIGAMLSST
jgi:hypothetical protein